MFLIRFKERFLLLFLIIGLVKRFITINRNFSPVHRKTTPKGCWPNVNMWRVRNENRLVPLILHVVLLLIFYSNSISHDAALLTLLNLPWSYTYCCMAFFLVSRLIGLLDSLWCCTVAEDADGFGLWLFIRRTQPLSGRLPLLYVLAYRCLQECISASELKSSEMDLGITLTWLPGLNQMHNQLHLTHMGGFSVAD